MTVAYFGSGATLGVYIDFTAGVTDTPAAWTDVTADVLLDQPISITRGRSSERDSFQTGTLSLSLLNTARKYDPEHAAGTYFGNLLPGRPIKVELTHSASTSVLFRGFIQGWPQAWEPSDNKSVVSVVAHDAFKYLALAQLPESRFFVEMSADIQTNNSTWWRLGEADDETFALDASGNQVHVAYATNSGAIASTATDGLITYSPNRARQVGDITYRLTDSLDLYCVGLSFTFEAWIDIPDDIVTGQTHVVYQQGNPATDKYIWVQVSLGAISINVRETAGSFLTATRTLTGSERFGRHHVAFVRSGSAMDGYFDGVSFPTNTGTLSALATGFGDPAYIGGDGATTFLVPTTGLIIDEVAIYLDDLSSTRIAAHYEAGSTAGAGETVDERITLALADAGISWLSTSLDTSQVTVRGADYNNVPVLAYLQALERTEQGRLFIAADGTLTFHDRYRDQTSSVAAAFTDVAGGSLPYVECVHEFDDTRVVNDAVVSRTNGVAQRHTDTTSRDAYGLRSATIDGLQNQSDGECLDLATATVARYKDPAARIRALSVKPRANPAGLFPVVRTLDIGSKVTVRRLPLGTGSAFTKTLTIEGVTHSISADGEWVTTYLTAPVNPNNYLILDDATYGQLDQELVGY
jgi:hypothetical protein